MASVSFDAKRTGSPLSTPEAFQSSSGAIAQLRRHIVRQQSQLIDNSIDIFTCNRPGHPFPPSLHAIGELDAHYLTRASRDKTVIICGGSKDTPHMERAKEIASRVAYDVVAAGGNIVTGCGTKGVMGAAFYGAAEAAKLEGAGENLTITKNKAWGDEDFINGRAISREESEEARFDQFQRVGAHLLVMPGAVGTLLEAAKMIEGIVAPRDGIPAFEKITIVDVDGFWSGLRLQLDTMEKAGILKPDIKARIDWVDGDADVTAHAMPPCLRKA
jgi:predicted Rossmann-fold nucleotide-binding protein